MNINKFTGVLILIVSMCSLFISYSFGQVYDSTNKLNINADTNQERELKPQTICPMTGGDISKDAYVDYKGQRIYLCCMGCEARFLKNPEKALQKIKDNGEMAETLDPASVQPKCPVSGDAVDPAIYVDHENKRIYFCCEKCQKKFNKKPEKFLLKMEESKEG